MQKTVLNFFKAAAPKYLLVDILCLMKWAVRKSKGDGKALPSEIDVPRACQMSLAHPVGSLDLWPGDF